MKIFKSLENFSLLLKVISETIENESKEPNRRFLAVLLGTLDEDLLRNMLAVEWVKGVGHGIIRADYRSFLNKKQKEQGFLMSPHILTNEL